MRSVKVTWVVLTAGLLLAGLYTGRREFFLLFFILAFAALATLGLNLWTALSFAYVQQPDRTATVKGTPARLRLGVYNDKPFPFALISLKVDTPDPERSVLMRFSLLPRSNTEHGMELVTPYRGVYGVGMSTLEVNDIYGLVRTRLDMRRLAYYRQPRLKVYPRLVELPALPARNADAKRLSGPAPLLADEGDSYTDLRPYRPGDPLKRVHRTASARRRQLYVKRYEVPMETAVLLALDTATGQGQPNGGLPLQDLACECAAAVAHYCLRAGSGVMFIGARQLEARGMGDFAALYEELATMPFGQPDDFDARVRVAARPGQAYRMAYLLTDRQPAQVAGLLGLLAAAAGSAGLLRLSGGGQAPQGGARLPAGVHQAVLAPGEDVAAALGRLL